MEDESRCSVCFEVFREPCTLPCGHSFCLSCIQATFERAPHRKCPLCGEKLPYGHKLRVSIVLRNMVQELEKAAAVCSGQHGAASEQPAVAAAQSDVASGAAGWAATEPSQAGQQAAAGASLQHAVSSAAVPSPARTGAASEPLVCAVQASQAPHGQSEEETSRPSHNRSASRGEQQHWHQRQHGGAAAAASGTQWPVGRRQPSLTGAAPASGVAAAAQLVLWALCSARAGLLHDCLWVAVGVALPPALAVWGRTVLWALLLAGAALQLAASQRWRLLAALLAGAAVLDAVSWLHQRMQRWWWPQPVTTGWPAHS